MKTDPIEEMKKAGWRQKQPSDMVERNVEVVIFIRSKPNAIINWQTYEQALEQLRNQKIGVALDLLDEAIKKVE